MKTLKIILSTLALATVTAVTSFAGPSNPSSSLAAGNMAAHKTGCPMIKAQTQLVNLGNPKAPGPTRQVTGYKHEGCSDSSTGTMTCKPTGASCASMQRS